MTISKQVEKLKTLLKKKTITPTAAAANINSQSADELQVFNFLDFKLFKKKPKTYSSNQIPVLAYNVSDASLPKDIFIDSSSCCIFGDLSKTQILNTKYPNMLPSIQVIDMIQDLDKIQHSVKYILLFCSVEKSLNYLISIIKNLEISIKIHIVLPANRSGWALINKETFGKPLIIARTPCAGSSRLTGQLLSLLIWAKWNTAEYIPLYTNFRYLNFLKKTQTRLKLDAFDAALLQKSKELNYFDCIHYHEWSSLNQAFESDEYTIIFLMRDPRDLITSYYWYIHSRHGFPLEEGLRKLMDGYNLTKTEHWPHYNFYWPSADEIFDIYLQAKRMKNIYVIKYEDLKFDGKKTIKKLLNELEIYPSLYYNLKNTDWDHLAYISSFSAQTNNRMTEGEHNNQTYDMKNPTSCRKGIVGDWKNTFPKNIADEFNEKYKEKLKQLGY